jgi:curved DNA-binding protein CbpA
MKRELYEVLGVDKTATTDEVRKAYRKKAVKAHPDAGGNRADWDRLQRALTVLSNPNSRGRYDRTGDEDVGGADTMPAFILQTAIQAVRHVIAKAGEKGADPCQFDIVAVAVRHLTGQIRQQVTAKAEKKNSIADIRRIGKRFKSKKGKPNRIGAMFESSANDQERDLDNIDRQIEVLKGAVEVLKDHTFDWERPEPTYQERAVLPNWFTRAGTGTF